MLYFRYVTSRKVLHYFPHFQRTYSRSLGTCYRREAKEKAALLYSDIHFRLINAMAIVDKYKKNLDDGLIQIREVIKNRPNRDELDQTYYEKIEAIKNILDWMESQQEVDALKPETIQEIIDKYEYIKPLYDKANTEIEKQLEAKEFKRIINKLSAKNGIDLPQSTSVNTVFQVAPPDTQHPPVKLSEAINRYGDQMIRGKLWKVGTLKEQVASLNLFLEFVGDKPVHTLTKKMIVDFKNLLSELPKGRHKNKFKTMTLQQIAGLKLDNKEIIAPQTQKKYLQRVWQFFDWCSAEDYCTTNVADGVKVIGKIERISYKPFTEDDLKKYSAI